MTTETLTDEQKNRKYKALTNAIAVVGNPVFMMNNGLSNVIALANVFYNYSEGADILTNVGQPIEQVSNDMSVSPPAEVLPPEQKYG